MSKPDVVSLSEAELEEMLVKDPTCIEKGMHFLSRQFPTDSGPLDMLCSDTDRVLCVIELKNGPDETHLDQGLRYYDWARTNLEGIARHYKDKVDTSQVPKLILIAPEFDPVVTRIAKYMGVPLALKEYTCIQVAESQQVIYCKALQVGEPPGPLRIPTDEVNLGNIKNEKVRNLCKEAIAEFERMGIEMRPKQNYWFSGWYKGKRFFDLGCKKQFFVLEVVRPDGSWSDRLRVENERDYRKALQNEVGPSYRALGGSGMTTA